MYSEENLQSIFGFPIWALYSLSATFIYAIIIAIFLQKYWSVSASEDNLSK
tara:strand:+ start:2743 stop:2895 length:153 start_codon:yes stop_codon:yes gene_type:complete